MESALQTVEQQQPLESFALKRNLLPQKARSLTIKWEFVCQSAKSHPPDACSLLSNLLLRNHFHSA
jgi:hypothetical protein